MKSEEILFFKINHKYKPKNLQPIILLTLIITTNALAYGQCKPLPELSVSEGVSVSVGFLYTLLSPSPINKASFKILIALWERGWGEGKTESENVFNLIPQPFLLFTGERRNHKPLRVSEGVSVSVGFLYTLLSPSPINKASLKYYCFMG